MLGDVARNAARLLVGTLEITATTVAHAGAQYLNLVDEELPSNWRDLTYPEMQRLTLLMAEYGWSLVGTPSYPTLKRVLNANSRAEREAALLDVEPEICEHLGVLVRELDHTQLSELHVVCIEALEAYRGGLHVASQAASTVALGHAVHGHLGYVHLRDARRDLAQLDPETTMPHQYRRVAVRAALGKAMDRFDERGRRDANQSYNRNASAHRAHAGQYRQVNSLTALMLSVSVLADLHDHLERPSADPMEALAASGAALPAGTMVALRRPSPA